MNASETYVDSKMVEEAAACVAAALAPTTWIRRRRIRRWIRRSPTHAREFLLAFCIVESCRRVDPQHSINVQMLLEEASRTVVSLNSDLGTSSTDARCPEARTNRGTKVRRAEILDSGPFSQPFGNTRRRTAVSLLLLPALPLLAPSAPLPTLSRFSTVTGEIRTIPLESGSAIALNERSTITIEHSWSGYTVHLLEGEAFFTIQRITGRRVSVAIGDIRVDHIGTRFDVRRSHDEATISVLEGEVEVRSTTSALAPIAASLTSPSLPNSINSSIAVKAGTEVGFHRTRDDITLALRLRALPEMERENVWTKGWLTFNGDTLEEVARAFNAHNRRQIAVIDPSISHLHVGGRFLAGDVESSISSLARVLPIRVVPGRSASDNGRLIRLARREAPRAPLHPGPIPDKPASSPPSGRETRV
jgi:ferric-dicitrate binding protein FerR (iron transport regulator)